MIDRCVNCPVASGEICLALPAICERITEAEIREAFLARQRDVLNANREAVESALGKDARPGSSPAEIRERLRIMRMARDCFYKDPDLGCCHKGHCHRIGRWPTFDDCRSCLRG